MKIYARKNPKMINIVIVLVMMFSIIGCSTIENTENEQEMSIVHDNNKSNYEQTNHQNSNENAKRIQKYKQFINELHTENLKSIVLALEKYKEFASEDIKNNDELFRYYRKFYNSMLDEYNNYFMNGKGRVNSETRKLFTTNGMIVDISESGAYPMEQPGFILTNFESYLSEGLVKFLEIREIELQQTNGSFVFIDELLFITWKQLVERIIEWEKFISKYQNVSEYNNEVEEAKKLIQTYLKIYTNNINISTFEQMNSSIQEVDNGLKESYQHFIENYEKSKYHQIIKGYYEILEENGFQYDEKSKEYLSKFDLLIN